MLTVAEQRITAGEQIPPVGAAPCGELGPWRLLRCVASGPICDVYQACPSAAPLAARASYAVKLLRPEWHARGEAVELVRREALVGRTVSHRHLVPVLAAETSRPPYFVVTPWIEGSTLSALVAGGQRLPVGIALWIARQAAEALDALHAEGWIHGDLKPENLLVGTDWHVTLLDLGFARRAGEVGSAADRVVLGTPNYLAPESFTSKLATDIRSDIYSLGVLLFQILAGRLPFSAKDCAALIAAQQSQPAPKLRRYCPTVPSGVGELVGQMLSKEPLRRPQTPEELIGRLARLEIDALAERF